MALIVVMDDDETVRLMVNTVLRRENHILIEAEDGRVGLQMIRLHKPDLVISDVQMPVLDGVGMLDALRADSTISLTPVILCTSLSERAAIRNGMTHGADDYLTKPFRPAELVDAVNAQLKRRDDHRSRKQEKLAQALDSQRDEFSDMFEEKLQLELAAQLPGAAAAKPDATHPNATLVYCALPAPNPDSGEALERQVERAFLAVSDIAYLFGAEHLQVVGNGLLLVFADADEERPVQQELRAVRAARMLAVAAHATHSEPVVLLNGEVMLTVLAERLSGTLLNARLAVGAALTAVLQLHDMVAGLPDSGRRVYAASEVVEGLEDEIELSVLEGHIVEVLGLVAAQPLPASAPISAGGDDLFPTQPGELT